MRLRQLIGYERARWGIRFKTLLLGSGPSRNHPMQSSRPTRRGCTANKCFPTPRITGRATQSPGLKGWMRQGSNPAGPKAWRGVSCPDDGELIRDAARGQNGGARLPSSKEARRMVSRCQVDHDTRAGGLLSTRCRPWEGPLPGCYAVETDDRLECFLSVHFQSKIGRSGRRRSSRNLRGREVQSTGQVWRANLSPITVAVAFAA
jgi:hypothetical protein